MLLEIDQLPLASIHPALQPAVSTFSQNKPVEAMELAFAAIRNIPADQRSADDWILLGNLAQTSGLSARCRSAYAIGYRAFPKDARLATLYAWELSARSQDQRCKQVLKQTTPATPTEKAMVHAVACYNHSINRWSKTALKYHHSAMKLAGDNELVLYILSRAAGRRTDWKKSIELGQTVVKQRPNWARAKAALFDSLLCLGKTKEAKKILDAGKTDHRHVWLDFSQATFFEIMNQHDQAIECLKRLVNYYPVTSRVMKFCQRQLALLLMKNDHVDAARKLMDQFAIKGFEEWKKLLSDDPRKAYISMPMVAQTQDHCVPTVAAMAATAQGFDTSPQKLAEAMNTRNGTPMWKMIDAVVELGFKTVCVKPKAKIVEQMLEQGIPLIGELSGVFSGHVDAVCGFNATLKLFHMRDPMHWYGFSIPYDALEKRYEVSCSLWALIAPSKIESTQLKPEWRNTEAEALINMSRAIALGQREVAEAEFAKVADDHPLSFARDCSARNVVLTAGQTEARVKKEVDSISSDADMTLAQIRSMLSAMDERNADHIFEIAKANQERLGRSWVKFVYTQALLAKMKWREAEKHLTAMTKIWPSMEMLWSQLAMVKEELGKSKEAEKCLAIALEITPEREYFQTKSVEQLKLKIPFREQLKRHQKIEARFPYSNELKIARATLLADSADGLEYESALRECIRFFPRNPWAYDQLSSWYGSQNRTDLAAECLKAGRELIGEQELATNEWETDYWNELAGKPKDSNDSKNNSASDSKTKTESERNQEEASQNSGAKDEDERDRFQRWFVQVYDQSFDLAYEEFQKLPELASLKKADQEHDFNWAQSASLLGLQLRNLLFDQSETFVTDTDARVAALKSILPGQVRGIPESFVDTLLEQVPLEQSPKRVTQTILSWADKIAPNSEAYPNLEFQKAYLLELTGKLTQAEQLLNRLVKNHPCFVIGWYRIGQLQSQRTDYKSAWDTYLKCLEIQPGHFGAMSELKRLAEGIGSDDSRKYALAISKRLPYYNQFAYEAAMSLVEGKDCAAAVAELQKRRSLMGDSACAVLVGRVFADTENFEKAIETIEQTKIAQVDQYSAAWVCIDSLVQLQRFDEAAEKLAVLDAKNPDDDNVIDQQVRLLRIKDPDQAVRYAQEKIKAGYAMSILAFVDIQNRSQPDKHAIRTIDGLPQEHRDRAATAYHDAISELQDPAISESFLEYCVKKLPHLTDLRRAYVSVLDITGKSSQAIKAARKLHEDEPENPEWLSLLGWAVQDTDPKESISLLKQEFAITDSVDTLAQMGRGYQLADMDQKALSTYQKVLQRNPNHCVALTNMMFRYERSDRQMLDMVADTIGKSMVGDSDQYFLVQAVKLANKHNVQLPPEWIGLAVNRMERLEFERPFRDERKLLRRSVAVWCSRWSIPASDFKITFFERMAAKIFWPGGKWVPDKPT